MDEYISNINTDDIGEDELLNKLKKVQAELAETKSNLDEKTKLYLDQKHQYEDLLIETKDLKEKYNNQENLLKFYEEKVSSHEKESSQAETDPEKKDKIKQLEIKIMNLNEKIKELEELKIKEDNELEVVKQELEEEKEITGKAIEEINEKDEEINQLKEKLENDKDTLKKKNSSELNPEEVQTLQEVFLAQQEEFELYKETTEKKN